MRKFKLAKLVRDKIVEGIIESGNKASYFKLSDEQYVEELKKKIIEEAKELLNQRDSTQVVKELADIQETIDNLLEVINISKEELNKILEKRIKSKGSFKKRLYIDTVETREDSEWTDYYLADPDKYPEIKD